MYEKLLASWIVLCAILGGITWNFYTKFQEANRLYGEQFDATSLEQVSHAMDRTMLACLLFSGVLAVGACAFIAHYIGSASEEGSDSAQDDEPDPDTPMDAPWGHESRAA